MITDSHITAALTSTFHSPPSQLLCSLWWSPLYLAHCEANLKKFAHMGAIIQYFLFCVGLFYIAPGSIYAVTYEYILLFTVAE